MATILILIERQEENDIIYIYKHYQQYSSIRVNDEGTDLIVIFIIVLLVDLLLNFKRFRVAWTGTI